MASTSAKSGTGKPGSKVAARKARATQRNKAGKSGAGREIVRNTFGCIGILLGVLFIVVAVGFWYGSHMMLGILNEVAEKDFTNQYERISRYEVFFDGLTEAGFDVIREEPKIDTKPESSAKFYLWRVQPAGSSEFCIYRWRYDLQNDEVEPCTNASLILDIELGYIKEREAASFDFYDSGDDLARAIAEENLTGSQVQAMGLWEGGGLSEAPVRAPLLSPEEAGGRERAFLNDQLPPLDEAEEASGSQESVSVGGSDSVSEEGGGSQGSGGQSSGDGATEVN